ncbi:MULTISPECIES: hypothetical protein [unclassified Bacteroides]|uniref:hypothetical protein n=1 Tax=unclassified Bacteroides TaxID=2646097 RepID=UPI0004E26F69|nr:MULTISPECIES: hypothetical protein [unclassified Bacteroides]
MWKETKVVKDVRHFYSFDARYGVYATTDKDGNSILYINGKEIPIREVGHIRSYEDKVVVQVDDGKWHYDAMLFTKEGELLNIVNDTISITSDTNPHYLNNCKRIGLTRYFNLVDIETGRVIFKEGILERCPVVFNDMIFSNRDNIITRYDWDGSIMWQHNYEPDFNVTIDLGFVLEGVCGGKLWVKSKHDRHEILLAIDVNTGELVKAFSDSEEDTDLPHCTLCINEVFLNQENGQVMNVYDCVSVIDSNTLNIIDSFNPKEEFEKGTETETKVYYIIGSNLCAKYITYLCKFRDGDQTPSGFFVYNTETRQIEFSTRMFTPKERSRGRGWTNSYAIQCYGTGIICAHEGRDWLHIFEDVKE